ncbi:HipA domain-containing protein, partial [Phenylobacterium sp.]
MATVRTYVFVHLAGGPVPAGLLTMTDEPRNPSATFAYGRRYLARPDRVPVDPVALPLHDPATQRTFRTEEGFAVFGGVRDAAPDGWGQYLMYKAMGDRLPSDIDLILASGDYRVGALAFGPTPERPKRMTPWGDGDAPGEHFSLEELAEAVERAQHVDQLDENLRRLLTAGSSLGGARPKAATELDGQPWIAKFQARNDSFPECRVELATMRLAATCGLDVPALDFRQAL